MSDYTENPKETLEEAGFPEAAKFNDRETHISDQGKKKKVNVTMKMRRDAVRRTQSFEKRLKRILEVSPGLNSIFESYKDDPTVSYTDKLLVSVLALFDENAVQKNQMVDLADEIAKLETQVSQKDRNVAMVVTNT